MKYLVQYQKIDGSGELHKKVIKCDNISEFIKGMGKWGFCVIHYCEYSSYDDIQEITLG